MGLKTVPAQINPGPDSQLSPFFSWKERGDSKLRACKFYFLFLDGKNCKPF